MNIFKFKTLTNWESISLVHWDSSLTIRSIKIFDLCCKCDLYLLEDSPRAWHQTAFAKWSGILALTCKHETRWIKSVNAKRISISILSKQWYRRYSNIVLGTFLEKCKNAFWLSAIFTSFYHVKQNNLLTFLQKLFLSL